ncbi:NB-ARC domain-containing protein [Amycolatopsis sp. NPDC049688]|uniref:ATP-binding protein n=1 Tax=Amycolatopsis sp. NPDC049688 TaxID=3154733 RepID=UPI0034174A07
MNPGAFALLLTAVLLPLAVSEFRDWCPRLATSLVRWAARRLGDHTARIRYEEEWVANLDEVPGKLSPLLSAVGYLIAVPRMRWTLRRASIATTKPNQLPAPINRLTVRAEFGALDSLLAHPRRRDGGATALIATIAGMPGAGKTTLALNWARRNKVRFPDGNLYADLHGYSPHTPAAPAEVLAGFLRALGVRADHMPASMNERVALYRSLVAPRRMLIMLDNAATSQQVRPLLPNSPTSVVLITSRSRLSALDVDNGAQQIALDVLSAEEAMRLLRSRVGAKRLDAEPQATRELVCLCACLPLVILIIAGLLRRCPDWTVRHLVDKLHDEHRPGGYTEQVRAVFDLSYQTLPADAQRLFRRLGTLQDPNFDSSQAILLTGSTAKQTERLVNTLIDASLISPRLEDGFYRVHDLTVTYARELLHENEPPRQSAIGNE